MEQFPDLCISRFTDFGTVTFTQAQYDNAPPQKHVYWQVQDTGTGFNGGVFMEFLGGLVVAARIQIKPGVVIPDSRYFNYLGTHEIGHTFGHSALLVRSTFARDHHRGRAVSSAHPKVAWDHGQFFRQAAT